MPHSLILLGSLAGDIIGSPYEFRRIKTKDFPLFSTKSDFTDDSVLTIATAAALLGDRDYAQAYHDWGTRYPGRGYGGRFANWLRAWDPKPYNSFGNGSAMRVSPVGCLFETIEETLAEAKRSAEVTHDHPEGIKGAQAVAAAIFMARSGEDKEMIRYEIVRRFGYGLNRTVDSIRPSYKFNETCQRTVPEAIVAFLDSTDYEDAIRNAVSLGGDADTLACITGGIAGGFYKKIDDEIVRRTMECMSGEMREVVEKFS